MRSFFILSLVVVITSSWFLGCGKGSGDQTVETSEMARQRVGNSTFSCEGPCQPGVGQLFAFSPRPGDMVSIASCTAFQVTPDIIMTNSHCIPDDLKRAGSNCNSRIFLVLPVSASGQVARVRCSTVIEASRISAVHHGAPILQSPDYAFLRLDRAVTSHGPIRPLQPARINPYRDIYLGDPFNSTTLIKVTPNLEDGFSGVQSQVPCTGAMQFFHPQVRGHTVTFGNCNSVSGNSGSPIVDANGGVRAILYAGGGDSVFALTLACVSSHVMRLLNHNVPSECRE